MNVQCSQKIFFVTSSGRNSKFEAEIWEYELRSYFYCIRSIPYACKVYIWAKFIYAVLYLILFVFGTCEYVSCHMSRCVTCNTDFPLVLKGCHDIYLIRILSLAYSFTYTTPIYFVSIQLQGLILCVPLKCLPCRLFIMSPSLTNKTVLQVDIYTCPLVSTIPDSAPSSERTVFLQKYITYILVYGKYTKNRIQT